MAENESKIQQTLVLIKPDGIVKSLTGNIISMLSETKLKLVGVKLVRVSKELAEKHYEIHKEKPFYKGLIDYLIGKSIYHTNRVLALVYQGENAIQKVRDIAGKTNPEEAHPTSLRGKYGRINSRTGVFENVIHASDSHENAEKEIKMWFNPSELADVRFPAESKKIEKEESYWA